MRLDLAQRARGVLPQGSPLPEPAWRLRHQVILPQGYAISRPRPLAERLATAGPTAPRVAARTAPA
jgi:hypothetical protein